MIENNLCLIAINFYIFDFVNKFLCCLCFFCYCTFIFYKNKILLTRYGYLFLISIKIFYFLNKIEKLLNNFNYNLL